MSKHLTSLYVLATVVAAVGVVLALCKTLTGGNLRGKQGRPGRDAGKASAPVPLAEEGPEPGNGNLQELIGTFSQEDLRGLLQDRLESMDDSGEGTERWAMELVDLLDEIRWMGGLEKEDAARIPALRDKLIEILQAAGGELIDDDTWNPARQRAVKISKTLPEGAEPRVTEKHASGLIFKGRLLRKQEVSLEKAP